MKDWKYYNHAMLPTLAPHEKINESVINSKTIWKHKRKPLLVRWTSEFDCGTETEWWYCIKDTPFQLCELKAKRRYEITKGNRNFNVVKINVCDFKEELYGVQIEAVKGYQEFYRAKVLHDNFIREVEKWKYDTVYGAFCKETGEMAGYACLSNKSSCSCFELLKTNPAYEKQGINAAIIYRILCDYEEKLSNGFYIYDGERNINHLTDFQDYLIKYFGFRRAYCRLNIRYRFPIGLCVKCLLPFHRIISNSENRILHMVSAVLDMEVIFRSFDK